MAMMPQMMPRGPGMPGAAPRLPPFLPKSPIGAPGGPGASPMVSPGNNAGKRAAAVEVIRQAVAKMMEIAGDFGVGSKEFNAITGAVTKLNPVIGHVGDSSTSDSGRRMLATMPRPPLAGAAPPGMAGGAPPMGGPPPGAGGGESQPM